MPSSTSNFGLLQPLVNSSTDEDLWGGYLNTTIGDVDSLMLTAMNFATSAQTSTFNVTAPTSGSSTTGSAKSLFLCNATSGSMTASLPAASTTGNGFTVAFKKTDSSANTVNVAPNNTDTIDGGGSFVISVQYAWVILVSDGTSNWNVISDFASTVGLPTLAGTNTFTGANSFTGGSITTPTRSANDSTTNAANTKFVIPTGSTLGTSWTRYNPDGSIEQGGKYTASGGNPTSQSFNVDFPTACLGVWLTPVGVNAAATVELAANPTTGGFTYNTANAVANGYWRAIGY